MANPPDPSNPNGPAPHYEQPNWQVQQVVNAQHVTMTAPERPAPPPDPNRIKMLKQARQQVSDVLHTSLWNEARIALRIAKGTARPYNVELQAPERPPVLLPEATPITQVYDQHQHQNLLLILGEPGGGKTTLLLELAEQLLGRAEADATHPLPVVFTLSTWGKENPAIHDWMADQLHRTYHVPKKIGVPWVEGGKILPLLDGLDEVAVERRAACVDAINAYRANHAGAWATPMVVCCRSEEYRTLPALQGATAITVQVLTHAEIDAYLTGGGQRLDGVRTALKDDPTLYDLLKTPLLLSIIALAFADTPADDLRVATTPEQRKQAIFAAFVCRMFAAEPPGRGEDARYPRRRMLRGLRWLARQLNVRSLTLYQMELMQPDWVERRWQRWLVRWSATLIGGLFGTFVIGGIYSLFNGIQSGGIGSMVGGFLGSLFGSRGRHSIAIVDSIQWSWKEFQRALPTILPAGIAGGCFLGLLGMVWGGQFFGIGIGFGIGVGVILGMSSDMTLHGAVSEARMRSNEGIQHSFRNMVLMGVLFALFGSFIGSALGKIISGLSPEMTHTIGNVGIGAHDTSFRLALRARRAFGVEQSVVLVGAMLGGLIFGMIGCLQYGARSVIRHYTLRLLLWLSGAMPWDIAALLDAAARRSLLRRVGGG